MMNNNNNNNNNKWSNRIALLGFGILSAVACVVWQQCLYYQHGQQQHQQQALLAYFLYFSLGWAVLVTLLSTWASCFLLRVVVVKAKSPLQLVGSGGGGGGGWVQRTIIVKLLARCCWFETLQEDLSSSSSSSSSNKKSELKMLAHEMDAAYVASWYESISDDGDFSREARRALDELLGRLDHLLDAMDKGQLVNRLMDLLLLHLKEYRRARKRVDNSNNNNNNSSSRLLDVEGAYRCSYVGAAAQEHAILQLVSSLAKDLLSPELAGSLSGRLLEAVLANKLFHLLDTCASPAWLLDQALLLLLCPSSHSPPQAPTPQPHEKSNDDEDDFITMSGGHRQRMSAPVKEQERSSATPSATDANDKIAPEQQQQQQQQQQSQVPNEPCPHGSTRINKDKSRLSLEGLLKVGGPRGSGGSTPPPPPPPPPPPEHRALWLQESNNSSENDLDLDEDKVSPVYEEPTDFASTIARLRCLLQQKSTATTPLPIEEKSCVTEDQYLVNLSIPWTEFYTAADGSQHLLYCIQFEDVEQRDVDTFETTTATVRRKYSDFVQLHANLEQQLNQVAPAELLPLALPEGGGRAEMESYLRSLCARFSSEFPSQLRHFLRPNDGSSDNGKVAGKKADAVAPPSFDRILARIVSGTFNTLKTVVPGFEMDQQQQQHQSSLGEGDEVALALAASIPPTTNTTNTTNSTLIMPLSDIPWKFIPDMKTRNVCQHFQQLISERMDYCSVDTAYEAVDATDGGGGQGGGGGGGGGDAETLLQWWQVVNSSYDDQVDELDANLSLTCTSLDLLCELLEGIASSSVLRQEAVVLWIKFLFGGLIESCLTKWAFSALQNDSGGHVGLSRISSRRNSIPPESLQLLKGKLVQSLEQKLPPCAKLALGKDESAKMAQFVVESFMWKKINRNLCCQLLEMVTSQLLATCRRNYRSPQHFH